MWSTRFVNRSRSRVVVNRLDPETVYQFAVLAENVLGSGKFSKVVTKKTQGSVYVFALVICVCLIKKVLFHLECRNFLMPYFMCCFVICKNTFFWSLKYFA